VSRVAFVTDFQRLEIDLQNYQQLAEAEAFFASIEGHIEDAVTGQRGDWDWYGSVHGFFTEVESLWRRMKDREREGAIRLNHDSPEEFLADIAPGHVREMGLVDLLTVLRKATCAQPETEEYNWSCPGDQPQRPDPDRDRRFIAAFQSGLVMAALHRLQELCQVSAADIEQVLRLKSVFDSLTVDQFRSWNGWEPWEIEPGVQVLHVPYPDYHPVVQEWSVTVYCTPFYIDPYREVPGKQRGVPPPRFLGIGDRGNPSPAEFFRDADLDEVRQYMAVCLRGEKWCDGHIASEFERGVIQAAFGRLNELFSSAP
jgi:hypothetical protein